MWGAIKPVFQHKGPVSKLGLQALKRTHRKTPPVLEGNNLGAQEAKKAGKDTAGAVKVSELRAYAGL